MEEHASNMIVPKGFLRRKFIAPQPSATYIPNSLTAQCIDDVDAWRICIVTAPNGYGKTSLLAHWHSESKTHDGVLPVWISLDQKDQGVRRMAKSLAVGLQNVDSGFLDFANSIDDSDDPEALMTELVNLLDMACSSDKTYVLMLDNIDEASSAETDEWIPFAVRNTADNIRFVFSGNWIAAPISDLLLDFPALQIDADDLSLNDDEMADLAVRMLPHLSSEESKALRERAAGWPMEFAFGRLAYAKKGNGPNTDSFLSGLRARYFESHVTDRIDGKTYEFLVETSMLDSLIPELCNAVTHREDAEFVIDGLYSKNLFVRYNPSDGTFYYLPTFKLFLQEKWLSMQGTVRGDLARRAAAWCLENNRSNEYRKFLALASDPFFLEATVAGSTNMQRPDDYSSLTEYLVSKRAEDFSKDPFLIAITLWSAIATGASKVARECIEQMHRDTTGSFSENEFSYADALCDALEGNSADSLQKIEMILDSDNAPLSRPFECLLMHMAGENKERLGDIKGARVLYQKALSLAEHEASTFYRMFDRFTLARQSLDLGNLDEAALIAEQSLIECPRYTSLYGEFNTIIAYVHIQRYELEAAETRLQRAREVVFSDANLDIFVDTQIANARLAQAKGDAIGALDILAGVVSAISGKIVPRNMAIKAYATQAAIAAQVPDRSTAFSCEQKLDAFLENSDSLRAVPCMLGKAHILRMRGEQRQCQELVTRCREKAIECGSPFFLAQASIFLAGLYAEEGKSTQATIEVGRALEISIREGYQAIFVQGGPYIRDLLLKQATSRKAPSSIRRFAKDALGHYSGEDEAASKIAFSRGDVSGYYALSEREREILRLLNTGMSRYEISERLSVSENTVKTHLKNIYSKLGVHTRAEAYRASMDFEKQDA